MSDEKNNSKGAGDISDYIKDITEDSVNAGVRHTGEAASETQETVQQTAGSTDTSDAADASETVDASADDNNYYDNYNQEQEESEVEDEETEEDAQEDDEDDDPKSAYANYFDKDEDILYENKFTYTEPLLRELYRGMLNWDKKRKYSSVFIYVLLGANVIMNIIFIIMGNHDILRLLIFSLILLGVVVAFRALEPVLLAKSMLSGYQKRYGETMDVRITFTDDYMTMHDVSLGATQQSHIYYRRIGSLHESSNFIVLRLDKKQVVSIYKSGFTKGSLEDFRSFLLNKIKESDAEK